MRVKRLISVFVVLAIIAGVFFGGLKIVRNLRTDGCIFGVSKKEEKKLFYGGGSPVPSRDEYLEGLKGLPSDIDGWDMYEKASHGLDPAEGSDSDLDGLTDKEEIEQYKTDPLKMSTAGDLYSDGYKVAHDMDLFTYYERDEASMVFHQSKAKDLHFHPETVVDLMVKAYQYEDVEEETFNCPVLRLYTVLVFNGTITIDVSEVLKKNGLEMSDIAVYIETNNDYLGEKKSPLEECTFSTVSDSAMITLNHEFRSQDEKGNYCSYSIAIINKQVANEMTEPIKRHTDEEIEEIKKERLLVTYDSKSKEEQMTALYVSLDDVDAVMFGSPAIYAFFGKAMQVWIADNGNDEFYDIIEKKMLAAVDCLTEGIQKKCTVKVYRKSIEEIEKKKKRLSTLHPGSKWDGRDEYEWDQAIFSWTDLATTMKYRYNSSDKKYSDYVYAARKVLGIVDNDISMDILPFQNFSSPVSEGGLCAGFALLTARLHNDGSIPVTGQRMLTQSPNQSGIPVSWDLSAEENKTLTDMYLYDYKDDKFVSEHRDKFSGGMKWSSYSEEEKQFVNLLGAYWDEANEAFSDPKKFHPLHYINERSVYGWVEFERLMDYLDHNYIAVAGFADKDGGHAVNIYGYEEIQNSERGREVHFFVYDNNYPNNLNLKLIVFDSNVQGRTSGCVEYFYQPSKSMMFSSLKDDGSFTSAYRLCVSTESLEPLVGHPFFNVTPTEETRYIY